MEVRRRLVSCNAVDDVWHDCLLPWFGVAGGGAWKSPLPTAVVTPSRAHAVQLLRMLSRERIALFNVRFWSVADLWRYLAGRLGVGAIIADPADLRLLVRSAARVVSAGDISDVSARTLAAAPEPLIELMRVLESGGWGVSEVEGASFKAVADQMRRMLEQAGAETLPRRCFQIAEMAAGQPHAFESLAFVGFDSSHFADFPVLKAATLLSKDVLAIVPDIASRAEALDLIWNGSWEQLCGEFVPAPSLESSPLDLITQAFDDVKATPGSCAELPVEFRCARDDVMQAQAIAREAAAYVHNGVGTVAVIVPNGGALSREISLNLANARLPHYCSLSPVTMAADERSWTALLDLLCEPSIARMQALLSLHQLPTELCARDHQELVQILRRASDDFLLTSVPAVGAMLCESHPDVAKFLADWPRLADVADVSEFARQVDSLSAVVGMPALGSRLRVAVARLGELRAMQVSRDAFCEWARDAVSDPRHAPPEDSAHPGAKIHVLRLHEAVGHHWDHVIFAGQNEGVFPAPERQTAVFSEEALERLNEQVKVLNSKATGTGASGEGQVVVRDGKSLCLGPSARRAVDVRDFLRVLSATQSASFYLSIRDLVRPGAPLQPGSFLSRVFLLVRGQHLTLDIAARMPFALTLPRALQEGEDALATRIAYERRRDADSCSGPFDFCLTSPATWPVKVTASAWARAVRTPAVQWMNSFVGVSCNRPKADSSWNKPLGIWVHGWLGAACGKGFVPNPRGEWEARTIHAAEAFLSKARSAQSQAGDVLPVWWLSLWGQAVGRARLFARSLSTVEMPWVASELSLSLQPFALDGGLALPVGGRLDLVFSDRKPDPVDNFAGAKLIVLDFKTGADRPLSPERMANGEGVQLGDYALRTLLGGASETGLCLLKPGEEVRIQMSASQATSLAPIWRTFAAMLSTGRFGQSEAVRSDYGTAGDFPLAMLVIPPEILEARRQRLLLSLG